MGRGRAHRIDGLERDRPARCNCCSTRPACCCCSACEARSDALTGLAHRGRLDAVGERLLREARDTGQPLSALMIDIDHFKRLNDSLGHQAGDEALRRVAAALRGALRGGDRDRVFRYGGDEFVVLLPGTDAAAALALAERLRRSITSDAAAPHPAIDVSIGLATAARALRNTTMPTLLAEADRQLYTAKQGGRGRESGITFTG